jgi:2-aminobenzoate-CoA ligase
MSVHQDTFTRDHLPPRELWPELVFDLPELEYPSSLNCASWLLDDAVREGHGNKTVLFSEQGNLTYSELLAQANQIANVLKDKLKVVSGNRVLLRGYNSTELVAAWFAVLKVGGVVVTTVPLFRAAELKSIASKAAIDHALCDAALVDELHLARGQGGLLNHCLTWGDGQLEKLMLEQPKVFSNVLVASEDVCLLAFTSGSTGVPKATMHFHRDILAVTDVVGRHFLKTQSSDIYLGSPPLGFTFGLGALVLVPMRFRASSVMVPVPSAEALVKAIELFSVTCLFTAPTMYKNLLAVVTPDNIHTLEKCVSAGEPLFKEVYELWHDKTDIAIMDGIGATEMLHIFIGAGADEVRPGSTGKPLPGYQAKVVDGNGKEVPVGTEGMLVVRGPTGCRYLDAPGLQKDYVVDGWNQTGDLYKVDEEGYFWFVSRTDDLIVSSGYNIAAPEVESVLIQHPRVVECAVVGVNDHKRGKLVKAFIVVDSGTEELERLREELVDFVKSRIAPYKYPRAIEFVDSLPKTVTGKLQRKKLLD